jgi:hypothetical protein
VAADWKTKLRAQWRETSGPKKAILALLPIGFVMIFLAFDDDEPPPPKPRTASSASASASASQSAAPVPAIVPSVYVAPIPSGDAGASPATSGSAKSLERAAADAVAAGSYDQAIKYYDALAKEHPDNPTWKEAARILRVRIANGGK